MNMTRGEFNKVVNRIESRINTTRVDDSIQCSHAEIIQNQIVIMKTLKVILENMS